MEKVTIHVDGMACSECEITVARAAGRLPGVKKAKAKRRKKEAYVEYDPTQVSEEQIKAAIAATGYEVVG